MAGLAVSFSGETWLGGTYVTTEGSWMWSDGSPFSFSSWGSEATDYAGNNKNCLTTNWRALGKRNDLGCSMIEKFVCKIGNLIFRSRLNHSTKKLTFSTQ